MIAMQQIDEACDRILKSDVRYRVVIDNTSLAG
jgi:D-arabinose 1-dehydrogenase-like Zn-dependent alcohol dehydrogenase